MSKSYDLSTSTKWANLADGEHVVKLRAKGSGYGTSSFSNSVTVTKGVVAMPVKGDLITIESKQYRVLKVNNSVAEVLAMYDASTQEFGSNNTYSGSTVDTYCNSTFYATLSSAMQNAIVSKTFRQDSWKWNGGTSAISNYAATYETTNYTLSLMSTTYGSSIYRKCYVLSCQDVVDYLEATTSMTSANTTLTSENVWEMFFNQTTSQSNDILLSSATSGESDRVFYIDGGHGRFDYFNSSISYVVRPAFQIDLSKITWSPVGG